MQENIQIKKIKPSDVEKFSEVEWDIIAKRFNFLPSRKTFFFGAYVGKNLVAFARTELRGGIAETRDLLVKDRETGKGIGTSLLTFVENWAKENNCRKSIIKTSSAWKKSVEFYKKNGYKKDAVLPNYYYNCDWYYMSKDL